MFGILGAVAFLVSLVIAVRLRWSLLRSPRSNPWYGLGVGVVLACLATALLGLVESAPAGIPLVGKEPYFYVVSPIPWLLLFLLIVSHRLLRQGELRTVS